MNPTRSILACIITLTLSFPGTLWASNWQWLKDTTLMSFDEQDLELLQETITQALDNDPDGQSRHWNNPQTGNSGSVQILDTRVIDKSHCRNLIIINKSQPNHGTSRLNYCRQPDGQWKVNARDRRQQ